ncbi:MAG: DUF692 family protein [Anaerolineae bacterium]
MKLAVNYSPQAADLLAAGRIEFDLYKTTEWPEMIALAEQQREAYVHFPLMAGRNNLAAVTVERIQEILDTTATPYVNTHLAPRATDFHMEMTNHDPNIANELMAAMQLDTSALVEQFGAERVILENANYDPNYDIPTVVIEPEMICRAVDETGCGFLLDLAHARMSAAYFNLDAQDYIQRLPLHALCELHVAGTRFVESEARLVDHYPMTDPDWMLVEWALDNIHAGEWPEPNIVALEYGGVGGFFAANSDTAVLNHDVRRLHKLVIGTGLTVES